MCTISSLLYEYDYNFGFLALLFFPSDSAMNNYTGWAGDLQTLMNSAYDKSYNKKQYEDIYTAYYNQMGKANDYFSNDDLYADIVVLGLNKIFVVNRNIQLEDTFNSYFSYDNKCDYVKLLSNYLSNDDAKEYTKKFTFSFLFLSKKIDQYKKDYNISNSDILNGIKGTSKNPVKHVQKFWQA